MEPESISVWGLTLWSWSTFCIDADSDGKPWNDGLRDEETYKEVIGLVMKRLGGCKSKVLKQDLKVLSGLLTDHLKNVGELGGKADQPFSKA